MMHALSQRGTRQVLLVAVLLAMLLCSALLYWKISADAVDTGTTADKLGSFLRVDTSSTFSVPSESSDKVEEKEKVGGDAEEESPVAVVRSCVPAASLWRLPASHFQYIPWDHKLLTANHAMELLGQPFDDNLQIFLRQLTNTSVCVQGVVASVDVFEILRYRYVPQPTLNRNMTLPELTVQAEALRRSKGKGVDYSNDFEVESTNGTVFQYRHDYHDPCFLRKISLKYDPRCDPDSTLHAKLQRQVLIVAVQRSGTHYIWEMMNRLGLDLHHEGVGPDGAVSWLYAINAQRPYQNHSNVLCLQSGYIINNPQKLTAHRFHYVFHQVRHPLRVISTLVARCDVFDKYWKWIARMTAFNVMNAYQTPLKRAMLLYWLWNRHMELYSDLRYPIEVTSPRDVCLWAKFDMKNCSMPYQENVNKSRPVNLLSSAMLNPQMATSLWVKRMAEESMLGGKLDSMQNVGDLIGKRRLTSLNMNHHKLRHGHPRNQLIDSKSARFANEHFFTTSHNNYAQHSVSRPKKKYERMDLTWADLDREDLILANELRIMSIEYGFPLDYNDMPQRNETYGFTA